MLINEVSKLTKLTKKAIEYYTLQGLVSPPVLENGYRDYTNQDIDILNKVSVLRKLDISIEEIRQVLNDETNLVLQEISLRKELDYQVDLRKNAILQKLTQGSTYDEISVELHSVEQCKTITDKLLEAFPGYYGRFVCMHFARFLDQPIETDAQQQAYETILAFLDDFPMMDIPEELEEFLIEGTKHIGTKQISEALEVQKQAYQNPEKFLYDNKEIIEMYLEFKKSDEYKNSPAFKFMDIMREFNQSNGYNDVFIPAMKQISVSYAEYYQQLEITNQKFLEQYPEMKQLDNRK